MLHQYLMVGRSTFLILIWDSLKVLKLILLFPDPSKKNLNIHRAMKVLVFIDMETLNATIIHQKAVKLVTIDILVDAKDVSY